MMLIDNKIHELFRNRAAEIDIKRLTIGLGYTAVELEDGRTGLAYTWLDGKTGCSVIKDPLDYEGEKASGLLNKIHSELPIERTLAVAAVNALNYRTAQQFPNDNNSLLDDLGIHEGKKVAMVGFFGPVVSEIKSRKAETVINDIGKNLGSKREFYSFLENEADALILTSTSLLNGSTEEILNRIKDCGIPTVLLGPSTIMEPDIYLDLPVRILAGMVPSDCKEVVRTVRNGKGTPAFQRYSRKVYTRI